MLKPWEIAELAAFNASCALSKLVGKPLVIKMSDWQIEKVEDFGPTMDPEQLVVVIYVPVTGDTTGASLLVLPQETSFAMSDLLAKREPGTARELSELDKSALKEAGNIVCANYLTVLSDRLQIRIIEHAPIFSFDMFGAITSEIIAKFTQKTEKALTTEIRFIFQSVAMAGHLAFLFEPGIVNTIVGTLESI